MLKKISGILILFLFVLQTASCSTPKQNIYHNSKGHFSFVLPGGWEEIPRKAFKEQQKRIKQLTGQELEMPDRGFQKISEKYFTYPYMILHISKSGKLSESVVKHMISPELEKIDKEVLEESADFMSDFVKNIEFGKQKYNKNKHMIISKGKAYVKDIGNALSVHVTALSSYGMVELIFYSTEANFERDLDDINKIISSFKFDEGYKY